ncbi:MAG: TspO/MBR family protein [Clostridium sp.]
MKIKSNIKKLILCISIPLIVGILSSFLSGNNMVIYDGILKSSLTPPDWVFPVAWTILYILMGVASYLVITSNAESSLISSSIKVYILQLIVNFFWSIIFFRFNLYLLSFLWIVLLIILILITIIRFNKVSKLASYIMIPYLLWTTFAAYLSLYIYLYN